MTEVEQGSPLVTDPLRNTVAASERERRRWARELHDETLQRLGAMRLRLAAARRGPAAGLGPAVEDTISDLAEEIAELRSLIAELSPVALEELGLEAALESLAHHYRVENGLERHRRPVRVARRPRADPVRARAGEHVLPGGPGGARQRHRPRGRGDRRAPPAPHCGGGRGPRDRRRAGLRARGPGRCAGPDRARRAALARRGPACGRVRAGRRDDAQRARSGLNALRRGRADRRRAAPGAARSGPARSACSCAASAGCASGGTRPCAR